VHNELYRAWKAEKASHSPQPLPEDFHQRMEIYLKSLREENGSSDAHTIQGRLLVREMEVAERLLTELREMRLRKIIEGAKAGEIARDGLTDEERSLVSSLGDSISSFKNNHSQARALPAAGAETELVVLRFLQEIPEIVGVDLKIYGPYKKEDVGSLPAQNAQGLINQGAAKLIDVRFSERVVESQAHQQ